MRTITEAEAVGVVSENGDSKQTTTVVGIKWLMRLIMCASQ